MSAETKDDERKFLAAAKRGERIKPGMSIKQFESEESHKCAHAYRAIICVDDEDVLECSKCGKQIVAACTFDDDYA
jgi:hypothetical protein